MGEEVSFYNMRIIARRDFFVFMKMITMMMMITMTMMMGTSNISTF